MKFGVIPINIGVQSVGQMVALAQHAEAMGFESVWTFEHAIVPIEYRSKYPYNPTGKMGVAPETNLVDPLIALAAIAAATKKIRLGTGVNILAQTNPLLAAKQAASLDFVSGGRFMYGVGIGWLEEEFVAMGTPFARRGARFDDYVTAMKKVWSGEVVEHDSEFINWHGFKSYPLPVQKPHVPIIMGGSKGKIYERIAKLGDGWYAPTASPEELGPMLGELEQVCKEVGRDYKTIEITTMWPGMGGADAVAAFAKLGVDRLVVPLMALGADPVQGMTELAKSVIR
jgi:probable F420-dependent oxidoreductase